MSGDIFGSHGWTDTTGIYWVETKDALKCPMMPNTAPQHRESYTLAFHHEEGAGLKCQQHQGLETMH